MTGQNQEQFLLLAKSAKGAALATLIHQVLEAPGVYVFGELLDMPNVRELAESDFASTFRLLTVFAYGTYADYLAEARNLPPLTEAQKNKLRHLSVVTLAAKVKCIPYAVLLEALALRNVRQLEDLVIEAVYADVLRGSLTSAISGWRWTTASGETSSARTSAPSPEPCRSGVWAVRLCCQALRSK